MEKQVLLRLPNVLTLTGLSKTSIYRLMAQGNFPAARKISNHCVAWKASEVNDWVANLPLAKA